MSHMGEPCGVCGEAMHSQAVAYLGGVTGPVMDILRWGLDRMKTLLFFAGHEEETFSQLSYCFMLAMQTRFCSSLQTYNTCMQVKLRDSRIKDRACMYACACQALLAS